MTPQEQKLAKTLGQKTRTISIVMLLIFLGLFVWTITAHNSADRIDFITGLAIFLDAFFIALHTRRIIVTTLALSDLKKLDSMQEAE